MLGIKPRQVILAGIIKSCYEHNEQLCIWPTPYAFQHRENSGGPSIFLICDVKGRKESILFIECRKIRTTTTW